MSKPFDAATKQLLEESPQDWLRYAGLPGTSATMIETNLTTITADADRVVRVESEMPYLAHFEYQVSYETDLDERVLQYNVLLYRRHRLPVQSVVILLRREADGPEVTGTAGYTLNTQEGMLSFRYRIMRVWENTPDEILAGGLATLPLAPLTNVAADMLPDVIQRIERRIDQEVITGKRGLFWTAIYLLMGLRYQQPFINQLLRGVRGMKESVTYQAILEEGEEKGRLEGRLEGRAEEAHSLLLRLGSKRFGKPGEEIRLEIEAITSLERLEQLVERLLEVENWQELLA